MKPRPMIMYNLFPLLAGSLTDWEPHLIRARDMGFTWIFINPIQRSGLSGSLYAIKDYFDFDARFIDQNSELSPQAQVRAVNEQARDLGLGTMIDLIINHCSVDSPLIQAHPDWFLWEQKGEVAHPFCDQNGKKVIWGDLAQFNYKNSKSREDLVHYFLKVIFFLVEIGFSGFRCDAAYQVPATIWKRLIQETRKKHPAVLFVAETLGCRPEETMQTALAGFDYIFNSAKWWDFRSPWLLEQHRLTRNIAPSISFPESHDTARLCTEVKGNLDAMKQRYLFTALFSAGVMMPIGFEFCLHKKLHVVNTKPEDWEQTGIDLRSFIKAVNAIKAAYTVFQEEALTRILSHPNPAILLMWKGSTRTGQEALLILNQDARAPQQFSTENLFRFMQHKGRLIDISPEYRMDPVPVALTCDLRPGQGIVLVTV